MRLAEAVRAACVAAADAAYEDAGLSGLCAEGRWELARDAMRRLDVAQVSAEPPALGWTVRTATAEDAAAWQAMRLRALREHPRAFLSSEAEEAPRPLEVVADRLTERPDGSFVVLAERPDGALVGTVGLYRDGHVKRAHRAMIWGMYVTPEARGLGLGRALVEGALLRARERAGLEWVTLGVDVDNGAARRLYRSLGFATTALEHDAFRVDGVPVTEEVMELRLR